MEKPAWTDARIDDLSRRVVSGFENIGRQFDRVDAQFDRVDAQFDRIGAQFDRVDRDLRELRATLTRFGGGIMVGLVGVIAAVLSTGG